MSDIEIRSKDPRLGPGSLWSALPIPACRVLTYGGYVKAALVLYALVLHSNDRRTTTFPSWSTINKYSSVGKDSLKECINTLERFGFVRVHKVKMGRTLRNQYELLRACWHWEEFNEVASRFKNPKGICEKCGCWMYENRWVKREASDGLAIIVVRVHIDCGGRVRDLKKKEMAEIRELEESAVIPLNSGLGKVF